MEDYYEYEKHKETTDSNGKKHTEVIKHERINPTTIYTKIIHSFVDNYINIGEYSCVFDIDVPDFHHSSMEMKPPTPNAYIEMLSNIHKLKAGIRFYIIADIVSEEYQQAFNGWSA